MTLDPMVMEYVDQQIDQILRARGGVTFTPDHADRLETLEARVLAMQADKSLGRIMNGPLWLSGASVLDGTVTADKMSVTTLEAVQASTGNLNVSGTITAAAAYPALTGERIVITTSEIAGYNSGDTKTFQIKTDGSGFIGVGSTRVSWTTAGVVTVPNAAISSLTIADVGSGTFNSNFDAGTGRVRAGTILQRVELTSAGLAAYNTAGTQTFLLDATNGSLTHTGTYTVRSAATGSRIEMTNVGIRGYNGALQTFELLSSNGSGFLGTGTNQIAWSATGVTIGGVALSGGKLTANHINVTTLSALTSNMGTITAGSITAGSISATTITSGTLNGALLGSGTVGNSAIGSMAVDKLTTGTISGTTVTMGSGGTIQWASGGSSITSSRMTLSSSNSANPAIEMRTSGSLRGLLYSSSSFFEIAYPSGGLVQLASSAAEMLVGGGFPKVQVSSGSGGNVTISPTSSITHLFDSAGRFVADGNIFPAGQIGQYIGFGGGAIGFGGVTTSGSAGASAGYLVISVNGVARKLQMLNV